MLRNLWPILRWNIPLLNHRKVLYLQQQTSWKYCFEGRHQKLELRVNYDRQSVGQSGSVSGIHLGLTTIFFLLQILFRQLRICYFVALSLWQEGGSVIYRCCWSSPAQVRSDLSLAGLETIFYCPNSWDSSNLEGQVPIFISPKNRVVQIYPRALGSLSVASYDSHGYGGGILSLLHTGN
jgi:hypothetical protein